jgi:hypothetical protein
LDLLIWGSRHEETAAPCAFILQMEKQRDEVLKETRRRWRERDTTPILPKFREPKFREGVKKVRKQRG